MYNVVKNKETGLLPAGIGQATMYSIEESN
jgi:hypothetical protein